MVKVRGKVIMGRLQIAILCSAATFCLASVAQAASLTVTQGDVLLSRGAGYETVKGPAELLVGDTVLGKPGSAAQIAFADGCTVPLGVGTVFKVGTTSPCETHSAGPGASGVGSLKDMGASSGDSGWNWHNKPVLPYVLGAAAIGGMVAGWTRDDDHDHHSASP